MVYTGQQPHTCATTFVAYRVSCSPSRLNTEVYLVRPTGVSMHCAKQLDNNMRRYIHGEEAVGIVVHPTKARHREELPQ